MLARPAWSATHGIRKDKQDMIADGNIILTARRKKKAGKIGCFWS